ncbi:Predicted metal-dependent hydrolase, TIM-barrel fold [Pseudonocardia thermophila]|uniref:Predicted metal-dependent hydrolase, TIM-barrel fold n=1 Tax=Pseudonocardia thermophila TaxID=1848 RepID=A0A1M6Y0T0_PSETH|nr:amidohydrolase family protein [Pseudonocardia thermophila]SHL11723.1 Predicted metal-dependent hydrolase, TIM-barrel fold [Pseudonocardia thermophila]
MTPLVDAHVHVFTADLPLTGRAWTKPETAFGVEELIAQMDAAGVTHAVISAMSLLADPNTYTLEALAAHPDRLRATLDLDGRVPRAELERLRRVGVVGVRWQLRRAPVLPDPADPDVRALLRAVADLGWHIEINVEQDRLAGLLAGLCASGVDVVVDHFGDPDRTHGYATEGGQALLRALDTGRVRVKLSAAHRFRVPPAVLAAHAARLLRLAGPERLFLGTDAPFVGTAQPTTYAAEIARFAELVPDAAVRAAVSAAAHAYYFEEDRG